MKIRTGFVSNSSSSSFIVAFAKVPESQEELQQMLFGDDEKFSIYGDTFLTADVAAVVWRDLKVAKPIRFSSSHTPTTMVPSCRPSSMGVLLTGCHAL
jgi:hypothetical protein